MALEEIAETVRRRNQLKAPLLAEKERAEGEYKRASADKSVLADKISSCQKDVADIEGRLRSCALAAAFDDAVAVKQMADLRSQEACTRLELANLKLAEPLMAELVAEAQRAHYRASNDYDEMRRAFGELRLDPRAGEPRSASFQAGHVLERGR